MFNMNQGAMMNYITQQLSKGFDQYPEEAKSALVSTEVLILREEKQIRIVCRSLSGNDEQAKQVAIGLGNALIPFLVRFIGGFKCKVKYQP